MHELVDLFFGRLSYAGMNMPGVNDCNACEAIEVRFAVCAVNFGAGGPLDYNGFDGLHKACVNKLFVLLLCIHKTHAPFEIT